MYAVASRRRILHSFGWSDLSKRYASLSLFANEDVNKHKR
jgi:hypothetical protein